MLIIYKIYKYFSIFKRFSFILIPPVYPPIPLFDITLWQGTMIGILFLEFAFPTAR